MSSPLQQPSREPRLAAWKRRIRSYLRNAMTPPVPKAHAPPSRPPPISKIPGELILKVIKLAAEDPDSPPGAFIAIASQVCSSWRALTLAERTLWATISIDNSRAGQRDLAPQLARAKIYAARASPHPIRLFLIVRPLRLRLRPCTRGAKEAARAISTFLVPHEHRLCEFSLRFMPGFCREDVRKMLPQTCRPQLRACAVYGAPMVQHSRLPPVTVLPWLEHEPAVSSGALERLCFEVTPVAWSRLASFSNLHSLELRDPGEWPRCEWSDLRLVLQANACTLTRLVLDGALPHSLPTVEAPIELPVLTTLFIGEADPVVVAYFSTTISAPALDTLTLRDVIYGIVFRTADRARENERIAFRLMTKHLPLHRVRRLHLSWIAFGPAGHRLISATTGTSSTNTALEGGPAALFPRALFARMDSLESLVLTNPDISTIEALNHAPPPQLERVGFLDVNAAVLDAFLMQRVRAQGPILEELWVWPREHYTGPDMGAGVAKRVVVGVLGEQW